MSGEFILDTNQHTTQVARYVDQQLEFVANDVASEIAEPLQAAFYSDSGISEFTLTGLKS
jgi:hypothetical protein